MLAYSSVQSMVSLRVFSALLPLTPPFNGPATCKSTDSSLSFWLMTLVFENSTGPEPPMLVRLGMRLKADSSIVMGSVLAKVTVWMRLSSWKAFSAIFVTLYDFVVPSEPVMEAVPRMVMSAVPV